MSVAAHERSRPCIAENDDRADALVKNIAPDVPASRERDALPGRLVRQFITLMSVPSEKPELLQAQYRAFSQQLPMMYVILMTGTWAVAVTHLAYAPFWLATGFPIVMTVASALRVVHWWNARHREPSSEIARAALRGTNRLAVIMALGFVIWTMMLFPYGDAYAKAHLAFFLAITIMCCIFCLMHLRSAAISVAVIVNGGFIAFFASTGQPTLVASAVTIALVSIAMLVMLTINYRDFTQMVDAQVRTQALSNENFRLANHDSLTDLPNRRAFFATLNRAVETARRQRTRLAVGIIDLDGFKPVNDLYGHAIGDKLLIEVSRRLGALCAPDGIHLSRLGGDEFALIVSDAGNDDSLMTQGDALCQALRAPFAMPEAIVQIAGSLGLAVHPEMAASAEALFERADYALYHGKRTKRGGATLFSADHDAEIHRDAAIEQALQMADFDQELDVVFQPIFDIGQRKTVAFEALARWTSPTLGPVAPALFIPIAERNGIVGRLTRPLLQKALATASRWPKEVRLAFNLSAHDLSAPEGVGAIVAIIERSGIDPERLDLEITETAFTHDFGQVQKATDLLKGLGCGISLDDFGIGYSSLSRLHALPLTKIKIDRSFVTDLHKRPTSYKIVKSLLALARDMGLACVVEGVETEGELKALCGMGNMMVQGYFYSPPLPEAEIADFLARSCAA